MVLSASSVLASQPGVRATLTKIRAVVLGGNAGKFCLTPQPARATPTKTRVVVLGRNANKFCLTPLSAFPVKLLVEAAVLLTIPVVWNQVLFAVIHFLAELAAGNLAVVPKAMRMSVARGNAREMSVAPEQAKSVVVRTTIPAVVKGKELVRMCAATQKVFPVKQEVNAVGI